MHRLQAYIIVLCMAGLGSQSVPAQSTAGPDAHVAAGRDAVVQFVTPTTTHETAVTNTSTIDVQLQEFVVNTTPQGSCRGCNHGCQACRTHGHHRHGHPDYWGHSSYYLARPFGSSLCNAMRMQIDNGLAAQLALYRYDFYAEDEARAAELNPAGLVRLHRLVPIFAQSPLPLVVEPSRKGTSLDDARREAVRAKLEQLLATTIAGDQVVVALPQPRGMAGMEALLPFANMLKRTKSEQALKSTGGSFKPAGTK